MNAWTRNVACAVLTAAMFVLVPLAASAQSLGAPDGPVILTVSGAVSHTNVDGAARFDHAMLERIGPTTLRTTTPWTEGLVTLRRGARARSDGRGRRCGRERAGGRVGRL
jgi:hypothetical protein